MTINMLGGDLGAMGGLAGRFTSAGEHFSAQSASIVERVGNALTAFTDQMRILDGQARALDGEIDGEMKRLNAQAQSTAWTGDNRKKADAVVDSLDDDILAIHNAVEAFLEESNGIVNGALTTNMTSMQERVGKAGSAAQTCASSFSTSVTQQQTKFNTVMNG